MNDDLAVHAPTDVDPRADTATVLRVCRHHMNLLRDAVSDQTTSGVTWAAPSLECQYPVDWDWPGIAPWTAIAPAGQAAPPALDADQLVLFGEVTHGTGWNISGGTARPLVTADQKVRLENLPKPARHKMLDTITEPFTLALTPEPRSETSDRNNLVQLLVNTVAASLSDGTVKIGLTFEVHPLVVDHDCHRAYYPVITSLHYSNANPGISEWLSGNGAALWESLTEEIGKLIAATDFADIGEPAALNPALLPTPAVGPRTTFPNRRVSVMSPIPMPRAAGKEASVLALTRGLGRIFAGYAKVPDFDPQGAIASAEASRLFWPVVERQLREAGVDFGRIENGEAVTYVLRDIGVEKARGIWSTVERGLNKREGGPGIEVEAPKIDGGSRFADGQVIIETKMTFWPVGRVTDGKPEVRFRSESSPGYVALIEARGSGPYFAGGWLWIPRRNGEREGFRIGGTSALLFPEARDALAETVNANIADRETELGRILRSGIRLSGTARDTIGDIQAGIARLRRWLAGLSVYEISHDLILCIFEAFYRQRNSWARQEIRQANGVVKSTAPWRLLRMDPHDLRLRLDPRQTWGDNWRSRLFNGLEALATFERQTRNKTGRKVDVGDRLVLRVIDGLRSTPAGEEQDPHEVGLMPLLRQTGAVPGDVFYIEVSVDFMMRLVTWTVDGDGIRWGIDATRSPSGDRGSGKGELLERVRSQPYYQHSPRLLAIGNLEGWPITRKLLASVLLQERTPRRRRGRGKRKTDQQCEIAIHGRAYVACNGAGGRGYRVRTWMEKAGHDVGAGSRSALTAFAADLEAVQQALDLHVEMEGGVGQGTGIGERELSTAFAANPDRALALKMRLYLPADLEGRLREHLAQNADIEATDASELSEGHGAVRLSGARLREARLRAGLDQSAVAKALGVSRMTVSKWERGRKPVPAGRRRQIEVLLTGIRGPSSNPEVTKSYVQ